MDTDDDVLHDPLLVSAEMRGRMDTTRYDELLGLQCVDLPDADRRFRRPFKLALTRRGVGLDANPIRTVVAVVSADREVVADAYVFETDDESHEEVAMKGLPLLHLCNARYP